MKLTITQRYEQAAREARWAVAVSVLYLLGWCLCAYLPKGSQGLMGFPLWFELACIYLPIVFIVVAYAAIKLVYQEIDLEISDEDHRTLQDMKK